MSPRKLARRTVLLLLLLGLASGLYYLVQEFSLARLIELLATIQKTHQNESIFIYIGFTMLTTIFALPFGGIVKLSAGYLFGFKMGLLLASSSIVSGSLIAFLSSRYLFRGYAETRHRGALGKINKGLDAHGIFYLFSLRVLPVIPLPIVNMVMGVTKMRTFTFAWVSALGSLPLTMFYVKAGTKISDLQSYGIQWWKVALVTLILGTLLYAVGRRLKIFD